MTASLPCRRTFRVWPTVALTATLALSPLSLVFAAETVIRKGSKNVSGDVASVDKTEVTVKVKVPKEETVTIPANEVVSISWTGEAPEAGVARSDDAGGRLAKAIEGYQKCLQTSKTTNPAAKLDFEFGIARCTARQALGQPDQIDAAIKLLENFRTQEHYRHYEALELLGELHLAKQDFDKAGTVFKELGRAPWKATKMGAKVQLARLAIAEQKLGDALSQYESVAAEEASGPGEVSQKQAAQLGKARVLLLQQKGAEALPLLEGLVKEIDGDEVDLQAEAYLRQGDCLRELGRDKDAILAYLRVDLLFAAARTQHAESLYQLSKLWAKVGQAERAEDARDRLAEGYPGSEWAGKLKAPAS